MTPTSYVGTGTFGVKPVSSTLTSPQTIKTYTLDVSDDEYITVFAEFFIQTGTASATNFVIQDIPLILNIGATSKTLNVRFPFTATNIGGINRMVVPITLTAVSRGGDTVTAQLGASNADDNGTFVNVTAFKIVAESGTRQGT